MPLSYDLQAEIIRGETTAGYLLFGDRDQLLITEDETLWGQLSGDVSQYEMLERDAHIRSVIQKRKHAVIAQPWDVKPATEKSRDKKIAEQIKGLLDKFDFDLSCLNILDAVLKGHSVGEIIWTQDKYGIYPEAIRSKSAARFLFVLPEKLDKTVCSVDGYELRLDMRLLSNQRSTPKNQTGQLPDRKFIVHSFGSKTSNPMGLGLGSNLWWLNKFKKEAIKNWLIFNDRFAHPTPYGKYPQGGDRRELDRFLSTLSRGSWASLPERYEIAFLEATQSGAIDTYEKFLSFLDAAISKVVLGETLTTEMGNTGSYAAANVHNDVRRELAKSDADLLSSTLNRTLIKWLTEFNEPGAEPPTLWRLFPDVEDINARALRDRSLFDIGFKLKLDSVKEIYGDYYEEVPQPGQGLGEHQKFDSLGRLRTIHTPNTGGVNAPDPDSQFATDIADATGKQSDSNAADTASMSEISFGGSIDHVFTWNNLKIGVEILPGQIRFKGKTHARKLKSAYGHIRNYVGADGEALDVYLSHELISANTEEEKQVVGDRVFRIDQLTWDGEPDEEKFMLGFQSIDDARSAYLQEMPEQLFGGIEELSIADLEKYKRPDKTASMSESEEDKIDKLAAITKERSHSSITQWNETIANHLDNSQSFDELKSGLFGLYPTLDRAGFAGNLAEGLAIADLYGRYEVLQETNNSDFAEFEEEYLAIENADRLLETLTPIEIKRIAADVLS